MLDREYTIPPCRVLYSRETGFAPDAPPDVLARPLTVPDTCAPSKRDTAGQFRRSEPLRRERPAVIPREVQEKPKRKLAYHPRKVMATIEEIRALQARGMVAEQIAAHLNCHADTIYARIRKAHGGPLRPKQKLTPEQRVSIVQRKTAGEKVADLAREFSISRTRVYELSNAHKLTLK